MIVSKRPGHAKPSIALDIYGHLIPSMQEQVTQIIDEVITPIELESAAPGYTRRLENDRPNIEIEIPKSIPPAV